tara:strand:+ start:183 stop:428 length:246 start_codon:yes stop_codon:yes gene_type:complete
MKETIILVLKVSNRYYSNREDLERIAGMNFRSIQDIRDTIKGVGCYTLTDFMDACNDTDDDASYIDISENWIGYVNLIKEI